MSVLIKGMEMPTSCFYCPFRIKVDPDNIKCLVSGVVFEETFTGSIEMRNSGDCPLVPIPPHGRLIDADKIPYKKIMLDDDDEFYYGVTQPYIDRMPTIIPASDKDINVLGKEEGER